MKFDKKCLVCPVRIEALRAYVQLQKFYDINEDFLESLEKLQFHTSSFMSDCRKVITDVND